MRAVIFLALLYAMGGVAQADLTTPALQPAKKNGKGTFCEFEVFDAESKKPLPGIRYVVTLPSGKKVRGRVPKNGIVHIDVPKDGECTIQLDIPEGMHVLE